jgi:hypothetical protein
LTDEEKENGITGIKTFVPMIKGIKKAIAGIANTLLY